LLRMQQAAKHFLLEISRKGLFKQSLASFLLRMLQEAKQGLLRI